MKLKMYCKILILLVTINVAIAQNDHSSIDHSQHNQKQTSTETDFAEREQKVMPFDLSATTHIFQDTKTGGIQKVIAKNPTDNENIKLIQSHLKEEADLFALGEFNDPSYLHGETMPGLADLKVAGQQGLLKVSYADLEDGAQIIYTATDLSVVIALHLWFQAQVIDHGAHATN